MKKIYFLLTTLLSYSVFAQLATPSGNVQSTTNSATGNVGIGTTNPSEKLDVNGTIHTKEIKFDYSNKVKLSVDNETWQSRELLSTSYDDNNGDHTDIKVVGYGKNNSLIRLNVHGNVGIGTTNPTEKLSVDGNISLKSNLINTDARPPITAGTIPGEIRGIGKHGAHMDDGFLRLSAGGGSTNWAKSYIDLSGYQVTNNDRYINITMGTHGAERLRINSQGNVGIGTTNPIERLDVNGTIRTKELKFDVNNRVKLSVDDTTWQSRELLATSYDDNNGDHTDIKVVGYGKNNSLIRLNALGNVGIGILNPKNKLDVNGTIHSKEVKVDMDGWADYVFKKDYTLPTLQEVEQHIQEKGHLPNIPSEKEVVENGLSLAENQKLLLQKIEELTLYIIEQNKRIETLEKNNKHE